MTGRLGPVLGTRPEYTHRTGTEPVHRPRSVDAQEGTMHESDVIAQTGIITPPEDTTWARSSSMSLDRLAPLIHELTACDLIYRGDDGAFLLRDDVQQLLEEHASLGPPGPVQVFVGRRCERCGRRTVTRLVAGGRLCAPCAEPDKSAPTMHNPPRGTDADQLPASDPSPQRPRRRHRRVS